MSLLQYILKFHATRNIYWILFTLLQHQFTICRFLRERFKEIQGQFRINAPFGQMIEPKGEGVLITTGNWNSFFYTPKGTATRRSSFSHSCRILMDNPVKEGLLICLSMTSIYCTVTIFGKGLSWLSLQTSERDHVFF